MTLKLILELLIRNWKFILFIVVFGLLMLFVNISGNLRDDIKQLKVVHKLEVTELKAEYVETARDIERKAYAQQIQAVNESQIRQQEMAVNVTNANDAYRRLSDSISEFDAKTKGDDTARTQYISAIQTISRECSGELVKLAKLSDGHVSDIRLLQEYNKRN